MMTKVSVPVFAVLLFTLIAGAQAADTIEVPEIYRAGKKADLPLPSALPLADYETQLYAFLEERRYTRLNWAVDREVRDTGPFVLGSNYGTHPAVRIHYSPGVLAWLVNGRTGDIPDGAMIIKEMFAPPAARYQELADAIRKDHPDDPAEAEAAVEAALQAALSAWTVLVKDKSLSKDGWFWANPAPGSTPDSYGYPFAFPASGPALGTCLRCHASATTESTFSSLRNIKGFEALGDPIRFRVDNSWRDDLPAVQRPAAGESEDALVAGFFQHMPESLSPRPAPAGETLPLASPSPAFLAAFPPLRRVVRDGKTVTVNLLPPSETQVQAFPGQWADRVPAGPHGADHFITSDNCLGCHGGLGGAPSGVVMFLQTGPSYGDGYNVSEFGEWRWSPMGLAGRDPIFYAQLESEFALLAEAGAADMQAPLATTCLSCHGAMGQRQLEIDAHRDPSKGLDPNDFKPSYTLLTTPLTSAEEKAQKEAGLFKYHKYGNLAREGISCAVCHHIDPPRPDPDHPDYSDLENFLMNSTTGVFPYSPADELNGPFDDVKQRPMENALGITPVHNSYIKDSRVCGTCHTINLPNVDAPTDKPLEGLSESDQEILNQAARNGAAFLAEEYGVTWPEPLTKFQHSIEQATFLEWQNSDFLHQSCQDCHMPGGFRSLDGAVAVDQVVTQIASIQDSTYAEAEHDLPDQDVTIPLRSDYRRHELVGLNVFMLEMFNQFDRVLGIDKSDFMTGASNGNRQAVENMLRQARDDTVALDLKIHAVDNASIEASVEVFNKVGHRFPSGVGFRRAFLEVVALRQVEGGEQIVWGSGRTNSVGVIVDGSGQPLKTEFLDRKEPPRYQPHHRVIESQDQVQIYEELVLNAKDEFTTSFVHRDKHPKDNRLLPVGYLAPGSAKFAKKFGGSEIVKAFMVATEPEGEAKKDEDFAPGRDRVSYKISLPAGVDPQELTVRATMYYQAIPPYWLHQRFSTAPDQPATQRLYYLASHLTTEGTPIENWTLPLTSASATVSTCCARSDK